MGVRKIAAGISALLAVVSLISLFVNSLNFGLDFTSGTSVRLNYSQTVDLDQVNLTLQQNGYGDAVVVTFGSDRDIRVLLPVDSSVAEQDQAEQAAQVGESLAAMLQHETQSQVMLLGSDYVSAKVGEEWQSRVGSACWSRWVLSWSICSALSV